VYFVLFPAGVSSLLVGMVTVMGDGRAVACLRDEMDVLVGELWCE